MFKKDKMSNDSYFGMRKIFCLYKPFRKGKYLYVNSLCELYHYDELASST